MNGKLGEAFAYEVFRARLPYFDGAGWRSTARNDHGLEGEGDDSLGHDFEYRDHEGELTGRSDAPLCLIEVKSTETDGSVAFPISDGEWLEAIDTYERGDDRLYVIVRVRHVRTAPEVFDVIVDPVRLLQQGRLRLANKDLWVRVAVPPSATDEVPGEDA
jgi:hypothetical protein